MRCARKLTYGVLKGQAIQLFSHHFYQLFGKLLTGAN